MTRSVFAMRSVAAVAAIAMLAGCSWRLETPEPDWPTPDAETLMRDAAAQREQDVIEAIDAQDSSASQEASVLADLEVNDAPTRLEALGGVYVPYPDASASPTPSVSANATTVPDAVLAAQEGHFGDALTTEDDNLAVITASAGLSHALSRWYATWVTDVVAAVDQPVSAERLLESETLEGETLVPTAPALDAATVTDLALAHDQAGYLYEVLAARSADTEREQWLARRDIQRDRAAALIALPGVDDLRKATYVTATRELPDAAARTQAAQTEELAIGETYATLAAGADVSDLPWLLSGAFDAYAQAGAYGDATVEVLAVPALPGVASP
ncbi:hypothetical protein [Demequina flava]|uniref:hypothetical protein n=1 Tax=Demequina flava TaxID=1095025 RepID=UPI000ADC07CA|nr:hypothetical protein [Demequina flava]